MDSAAPAAPAPSPGFHNVDSLPLGKLLETKQMGRAKRTRRGLVRKLINKGFR